jgi:hypothetical protein
MIFHHTGSMDTYITNKIVNNDSRATGANVGYASTIDLFKLYGETTLKGVAGICTIDGVEYLDKSEVECSTLEGIWNPNLTELSRGLIYFDLAQLKAEIENQVDITADPPLFTAKLILSDVQGTQVAPAAFQLELCPLTVAFEEGFGDNVSTFGDAYSASWLSPSVGNTWATPGGEEEIGTPIDTQTFESGYEDLEMDITTFVKDHWDDPDTTPNFGWMLKFTEEFETNAKSFFVKRFSSRHTRNPLLRPRLVVSWENYHIDDHLDFYSGISNNLCVRNYSQGISANTTNPPTLTLSRGDWSKTASSTGVSIAGLSKPGYYEASITVDPYGDDSSLSTDLIASGSLLLQESWSYDDGRGNDVLIHSGSIMMKYPLASTAGVPKEYRFSVLDMKSFYLTSEFPQIRLFVREKNIANEPVRIPIELQSQVVRKAYYQVKDTNSQKVVIPFSDKQSSPDESTRISTDSQGMYFTFPASVLPRGKTYTIDVAYYDRGERKIWESNMAFKVK